MTKIALDSESFWAIVPLQDLLELDDSARMNRPGTLEENWIWRAPSGGLDQEVTGAVRAEVVRSGRSLTAARE